MTLTLIPDIEAVVGPYLRADTDVTALVDASRILGQAPGTTDDAWVRITQLDARNQTEPVDHLILFMVQLDCYASKTGLDGSQQKEATLIARTVRASLKAAAGTHDDTVITGVSVSQSRQPDTDFEPARQRVILTAQVWAHGTPA